MHPSTIAILGAGGRFGAPFVNEFLDRGWRVRMLTRSFEAAVGRFPRADVVRGSMLGLADLKRVMQGASGAFLITPAGGNDDAGIELAAAQLAVRAARAIHLPHLIHLSLIQPPAPTGVPMLDVKGRIEALLSASGLPFSSLRTGCYMDIWLAFLPRCMRLGIYAMPVAARRRFSFTAQRDVARVAARLIDAGTILYDALAVIDPTPRSIDDVVALWRAATGRSLMPAGRWLLPALNLLRPLLLRWCCPAGASRVTLFNYFSAHDWVGDPRRLATVLPDFRITTMETFVRRLTDPNAAATPSHPAAGRAAQPMLRRPLCRIDRP